MQTWVNIRDLIEQKLQDTGNAEWTPAEIDLYIPDGLTELGEYVPYFITSVFTMESRTGSATSTSSNNLVDSQAQFLSTDTDKVIYNTTDRTWAIITSYSSATTVGLSRDIMASGEGYKIYNKECWQNNQINIGDVHEYLWIKSVEFPTQPSSLRNWKLTGDILTVGISFTPDDTKLTDAKKEVYIIFARGHSLSQLTDFSGLVNEGSGKAAGLTEMDIDGLGSTEVVNRGSLFTIAGIRGVYTVTANVTLSSGGGNITFFPGLDSAAVDEDVVTFIPSTLTPSLERLLVDLVVARASINKAAKYLNSVPLGGASVWRNMTGWGQSLLDQTLSSLRKKQVPRTHTEYSDL